MSADRVAAVLRIRRLQERTERSAVAVRRNQHRSAEQLERSAWRAVGDRTLGDEPVPAAHLSVHRTMLDNGIEIARQRGETTAVAAHALDVQVTRWAVAARRVEGLERLDERLRAAEQGERDRRTAIEIDDLVLARRGALP